MANESHIHLELSKKLENFHFPLHCSFKASSPKTHKTSPLPVCQLSSLPATGTHSIRYCIFLEILQPIYGISPK